MLTFPTKGRHQTRQANNKPSMVTEARPDRSAPIGQKQSVEIL